MQWEKGEWMDCTFDARRLDLSSDSVTRCIVDGRRMCPHNGRRFEFHLGRALADLDLEDYVVLGVSHVNGMQMYQVNPFKTPSEFVELMPNWKD
ncbi:hypothetical protein CEXT_79941 [Caerostris extrusa]|uniref:Uncharacterized protein n=1 Tax=Caerostris extrusa TaxID=172846 RepID=A0AAV4TK10_CAEEX|nr:hypothetical protein CEXT_79941 [Caerostris extrusa]